MSHRLDALIHDLAAQPSDYPLDRLETAVLGVMDRQRRARQATAALGPVRFASVSLAVAIGLAAGGRRQAAGGRRQAAGGRRQAAAVSVTSTPRQFDVFAIAGHLTPSTLLEGR